MLLLMIELNKYVMFLELEQTEYINSCYDDDEMGVAHDNYL